MRDIDEIEINPCPRCGEEAEIHTESSNLHWVECTNEDCQRNGRFMGTQYDAVVAWNQLED